MSEGQRKERASTAPAKRVAFDLSPETVFLLEVLALAIDGEEGLPMEVRRLRAVKSLDY